jgi:DNA polymerase III subunit chi
LIEKTYLDQQKIYIQVNSQKAAERLDTLLWTYRDISFLPHKLYHPEDKNPPAIQIGFGAAPLEKETVFINLCKQMPEGYHQFKCIIEIVFAEPTVQQLARERYKQYRDQGYEIGTHKIKLGDVRSSWHQ